METGTMNVSQNFGIAAYQGRMVVEVLTCVKNLQSRCDMIEDASAILGCAACCSGIENMDDGCLLDNSSQKDSSFSEVFMEAVSDQEYFEEIHSSQVDSTSLSTHIAVNQGPPRASYAKRLRKTPAGSQEEDNVMKKAKVSDLTESTVSASQSPAVTVSGMGSHISGNPPVEKGKMKTAKPRKDKDSLIVSKPAEKSLLPRDPQQSVTDEGVDAETAALEWQQCVSLLKRYGIIENPDMYNSEALLHRVPHPGFTGDGLQSKMCKICGAGEDSNNTVICDDCQEAFHLSCCGPRMTFKYFKREDSWFCISCRKQKKRMGSKLIERNSSQERNSAKGIAIHESKARLGCAHQADIPEWKNRAGDDDDAERSVVGCIGSELKFSEEQKASEKDHLLRTFNDKVNSLGWLPADKLPDGTLQNWVKCHNIVARAYKDPEGRKHNEIVCGKWRRAPLNVVQTDSWECFCATEWDPLHADCAIPQECSDEEVFKRISFRMQTNTDAHAFEVGTRKSTLRPGKF